MFFSCSFSSGFFNRYKFSFFSQLDLTSEDREFPHLVYFLDNRITHVQIVNKLKQNLMNSGWAVESCFYIQYRLNYFRLYVLKQKMKLALQQGILRITQICSKLDMKIVLFLTVLHITRKVVLNLYICGFVLQKLKEREKKYRVAVDQTSQSILNFYIKKYKIVSL